VVIRDDSGEQIATSSLAVPADGHTSFVLPTQYPITANLRGTIEFDTPSGGRISVLGMRFTPPNNALTTIPALANVGTNGGSIAHMCEALYSLKDAASSDEESTRGEGGRRAAIATRLVRSLGVA